MVVFDLYFHDLSLPYNQVCSGGLVILAKSGPKSMQRRKRYSDF